MAARLRGQRRCNSFSLLTCTFFLCVVLLMLTYYFYDVHGPAEPVPKSTAFVQILGPRQMSSRVKKRVLLWTKAWNVDWDMIVKFDQCPVSDCVVTKARSELEDSDAVVFHLSNLDLRDLPTRRSPNQAWVFYNLESPCATRLGYRSVDRLFNWTMSYRRDSDVFSPYGIAWRLSKEERGRLDYTWQKQNRTKLAVWIASNCNDRSHRKEVVAELAKYIPVDTFGACGKGKLPAECGRYTNSFCPHILRGYKFYLSFENAICRDYLTEKVWYAIRRDQVPVVLGGDVEYSKLLPPHSFISLAQFKDVRALATYLQHLDAHPEEYNRYFAWREVYKPMDNIQWCSLCAALHDSKRPAQVYTHLEDWIYEDLSSCQCGTRRRSSLHSLMRYLPFVS